MAVAFSPDWAQAWCRALNASETYRVVAAAWEGSIALVAEAGGERSCVFLDLHHGACRGARVATESDQQEATYVLEAASTVWRELLEGKGSPVMALMTGRLQLARGEIASLLPYAGAAKELLDLGSRIETSFPEGW